MDLFDDDIPGPVTQELPIADYKHLTRLDVESLSRRLDAEDLEVVLRYERRHRDRAPVVRLLTARLRYLRDRMRASGRIEGGYGPAPRSAWRQ